MLELVLLDGSERRFPLREGAELTVGAAAHCAVRLNAPDISRKHALVTCFHGKAALLDLGSTNGTFVNGRRVKESELKAGDAVRFSSVIAQVVPPSGDSGTQPDLAGQARTPVPEQPPVATSDRIPVVLMESLIWLLSRWGAADGNAVAALVDWLVAQRGMEGALVIEEVGGEIVVSAAGGAVTGLLDDQSCRDVLRTPHQDGTTVESVQLACGDRQVLAVRGASLPWLVVQAGSSMPDGSELELFVRLLNVARLLDTRQ